MIALTLAVAIAAAPARELTVSHRKVPIPSGCLALYRYAPPGNGGARPPVLLVADVGFGRSLFDFEGRGLARWLAQRGFLVYVGELRGQGRSSAGSSLAAIVSEELPALVAAILKDRGESAPRRGEGSDEESLLPSGERVRERGLTIDLVVQGWAGTLALAATGVELDGRVRRVVALNTPALAEVPSELAQAFLASGGRFTGLESDLEFELLFAMGGQFPVRTLQPFRLAGARDLSPRVAAALLGWMRSGELELADGSTVTARLARYDRPTLQLLGIADGFANPELCAPLRDVSRAAVEVRAYSRVEKTEDYSHVSMLLGAHAPREVFTRIEAFLAKEDAP